MSEKILIANAREAWLQACIHCNLILDGYVTLQYKKMFVSSLHNSVELLMKQRMLDLNDFRVAKIKKIDSNGLPAKNYFSSTDLNAYFKENGTKDEKGKPLFYSIEFYEFHTLHKEIFADYYSNNKDDISVISAGITLLENLRNDETHFYVNDIDFLNGSEFKSLQTFMISFTRILDFYSLLPTYTNGGLTKIQPNNNIPEKSRYPLFLKDNADYKTIASFLNGKSIMGKCDAFDIIDFLWFNTNFDQKTINCNYDEAISLLSGAIQYNLVKFIKKQITDEDQTYTVYVLDFKI